MDSAKSTTKKQVITIKYINLTKKLKELEFAKNYDSDLFPSLETIDIIDLLFYFQFLFGYTTDKYITNLKTSLKLKNVVLTDSQFEEVYKIVYPFLIFIKNFS